MSEWRPIELAPRTGENIIGASFGRYPYCGRVWWQKEFDAFISSCRQMSLATNYTFEDGSREKLHSPDIPEVTHWIPYPPEPPK